MRRNGYLNGVLTVIAVLLALLLADRHLAGSSAGTALAAAPEDQPTGEGAGLISASEQRKQMIAELRRMAARLERIEARLGAGISVKVTEMPELKAPASGDGGAAKP
jgi:hypothetical protein